MFVGTAKRRWAELTATPLRGMTLHLSSKIGHKGAKSFESGEAEELPRKLHVELPSRPAFAGVILYCNINALSFTILARYSVDEFHISTNINHHNYSAFFINAKCSVINSFPLNMAYVDDGKISEAKIEYVESQKPMLENIDDDPIYSYHEQRKIIRHIDVRLVVMLGFLHTVALIDRGNLGTASVAGMQKELHLHGTQYVSSAGDFRE